MKPALMIIDMQKAYFNGQAKTSMASASGYINKTLKCFRKAGFPVIWVQNTDKESGPFPNETPYEILDILDESSKDIYISKEYENSFRKTACEKILKVKGINIIILAGFCAESCVLSTYHGARDLDFTPLILKNGIASVDKNNIKFVEKISDTIPYTFIKKITDEYADKVNRA